MLLTGKIPILMAMFNSYVTNYQRVMQCHMISSSNMAMFSMNMRMQLFERWCMVARAGDEMACAKFNDVIDPPIDT